MNAKELRLGNWFQDEYTGDKFQVVYISDGVIGFDYETSAKWQAEPIPITEEILKKCGIKYLGYRAENDCKVFGNKNTDFTLLRGSKRSLLPGQSLFYMIHGEWLGCDIEHLHQLQNLYFSLTGKELEVNL